VRSVSCVSADHAQRDVVGARRVRNERFDRVDHARANFFERGAAGRFLEDLPDPLVVEEFRPPPPG
jgi:hypothetical protein